MPLVEIERILTNPLNPREDPGDVTELAASIRQVGLVNPIVCSPVPGGDLVMITGGGHRRLLACQQAGLSHVPVILRRAPEGPRPRGPWPTS